MSYLNERIEKNCLNCNAQIVGKYCSVCGQENIHPNESLGHLVSHYIQDITHFDGKFFSTIKLLIARPGFLSNEYVRGRRTSYLNPIRLYVFTSAFFFLIFFSFIQKDEEEKVEKPGSTKELTEKLNTTKLTLEKSLSNEDRDDAERASDNIKKINDDRAIVQKDPDAADSIKKHLNSGVVIRLKNKYTSEAAYDSIQQKLPDDKKDSWLASKMQRRVIAVRIKYNGDTDKMQAAIVHKFKHSFPQLLFLSLPFFALALKIVYLRRKQFYYVNHIIFTIHLYCAVFILLLVAFGFNALESNLHWRILGWIATIIAIGIFFYQFKAMSNFYQQPLFKTILKYLLMNIAMIFIISFLALGMFVFTVFQI